MHYTFENSKTKKVVDLIMSLAERDQYVIDNPHMIQIIKPSGFIGGVGNKPDEGFRDILREIKKAHPNGTVDTF